MNSHIQIPRCILKEFTNNENYFYRYNISKKLIDRGFPKSTFTEENYYSKEMEAILNSQIESKLKSVVNYLNKIISQNCFTDINENTKKIIFIYIKSLISRDPKLVDEIDKNSIFYQFINVTSQHDFAVDFAMKSPIYDSLINKFEISFLLNRTNIPFVLLTKGLYSFSFNNVQCINSPITPQCAILLIKKDEKSHKKTIKTRYLCYHTSKIK